MTALTHGSLSSERAIENLISSYAFLNDDADIVGLGELFADAVCTLDGVTARGRQEVETLARNIIDVGADGRSSSSHEITNIMIEVDEVGGTAIGRAYWTLYQAVSGTPRQPVLAGRYLDRFERRDGRWRFAERIATSLWQAAG
jgi:ketosteroid isomerase-like protein